MALNDILTSMDGARDALVTAINAKGGSLADNATLYQCADAVGSLSGGTSTEYYKCASVTPGVSGAVIEVTGDTAYGCNGTYTIVDATATGKNRTWRTSDGVWEIRNTNATAGIDRWCIFDVASDTLKIRSVMPTVPDNPWEVTSWQNNTSPYAYPDLVLTPYDTAKTWSGYKAVFDSGTGTWSFESGVTAGLTYTSVTPIVGGIYSADALVIVSLLYTGTPTLTSPTGMTSESSDEWEISASDNYGAYYPWKAFDGITDPMTNCWTGNSGSSWWIQWQNKQKQVLVQRLKMTVADSLSQQAVLSFTLQGSDDGNTWTDIHSESGLSWTTNGESKEFTFANSKSYYYHRLVDITAPSFPTILELETYDL